MQAASKLARILVLGLLTATYVDSQTPSSTTGGIISVRVNRVNVGVTVTGRGGNFIKGLKSRDFHVFDNGVEQPLTGFAATEAPNNVLLLIESGPAAYILGKNELEGLDALLDALGPADRLAIATYSDHPRMLDDFSTDRRTSRAAIGQIKVSGSLGPANLSSSVLVILNWLDSVRGRKTLVLVSTGVDTSLLYLPQLETRLLTSDVRILAISPAETFPKLSRWKVPSSDQKEARKYLKQGLLDGYRWLESITTATGGLSYSPKTEKDFEAAYSEIARSLRGEYRLEFSPPSLDGRLHFISVKADRLWCHVQTRQAYLAPNN